MTYWKWGAFAFVAACAAIWWEAGGAAAVGFVLVAASCLIAAGLADSAVSAFLRRWNRGRK